MSIQFFVLFVFIITAGTGYAQNHELHDLYELKPATDMPLDAAFEHYDKAIKQNPRLANAYVERGYIELLRKNYDNAILDFQKSTELKKEINDSYLFLAIAYSILGQKEKSMEMFKSASAFSRDTMMFLRYYTVFNLYHGHIDTGCNDLKTIRKEGISISKQLEKKCN